MENVLTKGDRPGALVPADLVQAARDFVEAAKSPRTRQAYKAAFAGFAIWCEGQGLSPLPATPETVALFLSFRAEKGVDWKRRADGDPKAAPEGPCRVSAVELDLVAISQAHQAANLDSPRSSAVVREVMKGIRRSLGVAPSVKAPVLVSDLKAMLQHLDGSLLGVRDRALLLVGFAGGFRRTELVGLNVEDVVFTADGAQITLWRSKTDQEGEGRKVGLPFGSSPAVCPVRSLKAWLTHADITEGAIFRPVDRHGHVGPGRLTDRSVARVVKRTAALAGLDNTLFAGHSLRAGLATSAAKAGKSERSIMAQTGHRSERMVRRYIRDADLFTENAAAGLL